MKLKTTGLYGKNKRRLGVQAIIYKQVSKGTRFLILKRVMYWRGWEFVKGGVEKGETLKKAVLREIREETNINSNCVLSCLNTGVEFKFDYSVKMQRERGVAGGLYKTFIVRVKSKCRVKIDQIEKEHDGFAWVSKKEVLRMVKRKNLRDCFEKIYKKK